MNGLLDGLFSRRLGYIVDPRDAMNMSAAAQQVAMHYRFLPDDKRMAMSFYEYVAELERKELEKWPERFAKFKADLEAFKKNSPAAKATGPV